jgi:hypothetical protein
MRKAGSISAVIYLVLAVIVAGLFLLGTLPGIYTPVDRIGGAVWVFILAVIILMPVVISRVKSRRD